MCTAITRDVDGIIPTPLGFMPSGSVIQALYVFQLITNIGSCQVLLPTMGLRADFLEEDVLEELICISKYICYL